MAFRIDGAILREDANDKRWHCSKTRSVAAPVDAINMVCMICRKNRNEST